MEPSLGMFTVGGYFASLLVVLCVVVRDIYEKCNVGKREVGLLMSSVAAFCCTWFHIVKWLEGDMAKEEFAGKGFWVWLDESDLFVSAYVQVADSPVRWFWSSQLLSFVLPWVVFVSVSSAKKGISVGVTLAYIWLGFAGAISLALPLHLVRAGPLGYHAVKIGKNNVNSQKSSILNTPTVVLTVLSGASILALPGLKDTGMFWIPLAVLHVALLLVPFFSSPEVPSAAFSGLFRLLFVFCALSFWANFAMAVSTTPPPTPSDFWTGIWANHCQSSITFDLFFVTGTSFGSMMFSPSASPSRVTSFLMFLVGFVASPGAALALWLSIAAGSGEEEDEE